MGVRHWPRRVAHYHELTGFEHGRAMASDTQNPDIQTDRAGLAEGSLLKR
ncbi:hypothetical protein C4J97_3396 [Pseudomonas orientalis]|nr:hypothetical protein C4J97_3396 [Pseudomonas orientalis]